MEDCPATTAAGVDDAQQAVERARAGAAEIGVLDWLELHRGDATGHISARKADLVVCVGVAHLFGGLLPTLAAARTHLAPDGTVLIGDGFWEREPGAAVLEELGAGPDEYADLATSVAKVVDDGWTPVYGHVSTTAEWDEDEWCWTGSLAEWALDNRGHPDSRQALEAASTHRTGWLDGYRGVPGFVSLLLRPTAAHGGGG